MQLSTSKAWLFVDWFADVVKFAPQASNWGPWRVGASADGHRLAVCPDCQARAAARGFYGLFSRGWEELDTSKDGGRQCAGGCNRWAPVPKRDDGLRAGRAERR